MCSLQNAFGLNFAYELGIRANLEFIFFLVHSDQNHT